MTQAGTDPTSQTDSVYARQWSLLQRLEAELPDPHPIFEKIFASRMSQFAVCLAAALLFRFATFGDPAVHVDEEWYFLVGQLMHDGALPYVDVWDRKPVLLFVLYYIFASISDSVLSYQIAALASASLTAFIVVRICSRFTGPQGSVLAATVYIALLNQFDGIGGQTPVFYNLFIAMGAYAIVSSLEELSKGRIPVRIFVAMFLCGLAIQIKQTTLFEAAFFGLTIVTLLWRSNVAMPWMKIAVLAALGAGGTVAVSLFYFASGHWDAYWQAMVESNLSKQNATTFQYVSRVVVLALRSWLLLVVLFFAFRFDFEGPRLRPYRPFLIGWMVAALVGFLSVPNLYFHYMLPVVLPAAVIGSLALNRRMVGLIFALMLAFQSILTSEAFAISKHRSNAESMVALSEMIAAHSPRDTLLVFDGPPLLYTMSGSQTLTPLVFPNHLNHLIERDVSHIATGPELRRILAERPGAVVLSEEPRVLLYDEENWNLVQQYVSENCRWIGEGTIQEIGREDRIFVYGDCE